MSQQYTNLAQTILGSLYTVGDNTLSLTFGGGANFPTTGLFIVAMNNPPTFFLTCTGRSSDVLTDVSATGSESINSTMQMWSWSQT